MQLVAEDPLAREALLPSSVSLASTELREARSFEASRSNFTVAPFACCFGLSPVNSSSWYGWFLMDTLYCSQMMSYSSLDMGSKLVTKQLAAGGRTSTLLPPTPMALPVWLSWSSHLCG